MSTETTRVYRVRNKKTGGYYRNLSTGTTFWQRRGTAESYKAMLRNIDDIEVVEFELREVKER
ncbi:MAG: hypothetical protein OEL83_19325 [Desulforhopalus sp.]|nr:hypothetical protein [Desulforhopalus sp.]